MGSSSTHCAPADRRSRRWAPDGVFKYLADRPEEARLFGEAMTAKAHGHVASILGAYDFSGFHVIGDIGGGHGHLLRAVLERAPAARGVLFDLPNVLREVADLASERLMLQPGDFFSDPLPACDAYLLMEVIHDWGDEEATAILKAVRAAAPAHAKLLMIEQLVPDEPGPHWAKTLDVLMLAVAGGSNGRGRSTRRCSPPPAFGSSGCSIRPAGSQSWKPCRSKPRDLL